VEKVVQRPPKSPKTLPNPSVSNNIHDLIGAKRNPSLKLNWPSFKKSTKSQKFAQSGHPAPVCVDLDRTTFTSCSENLPLFDTMPCMEVWRRQGCHNFARDQRYYFKNVFAGKNGQKVRF
jgi:hypothetical protein